MAPLRVLGVAVVAFCTLVPAAGAAVSVQVQSDGLAIRVVSGDSRVHVQVDSGNAAKLIVSEVDNHELQPQTGCQTIETVSPGTPRVRCNRPAVPAIVFTGSTGRDRLTLTPGVGDCVCVGGDGNDTLTGSDGADLMRGEAGDDVLEGAASGDDLQGQAGNDTLRAGDDPDKLSGGDGNDTLDGGAGDDILVGVNGNDTLDGGAGDDTQNGGAGPDVFLAEALPDGADIFEGGTELDTVSYAGRRSSVAADLDGQADDGQPPGPLSIFGERDRIGTDVERLTGSTAADTLTGDGRPNVLDGGPGDDTLRGGDPAGTGSAAFGPDDTLIGGPGADVMRGEGGKDTLLARDGADDQAGAALSCGTGPGSAGQVQDVLEADLHDDDTRPLPSDCEQVSFGVVDEFPATGIRSARRTADGLLAILLACPRKKPRGCSGTLAAKLEGAAGAFGSRRRYSIRRGRSRKVVLPAEPAAVAKRGTAIRIRSAERGRHGGERHTLRTLIVR